MQALAWGLPQQTGAKHETNVAQDVSPGFALKSLPEPEGRYKRPSLVSRPRFTDRIQNRTQPFEAPAMRNGTAVRVGNASHRQEKSLQGRYSEGTTSAVLPTQVSV